jgi:hypothetical protein
MDSAIDLELEIVIVLELEQGRSQNFEFERWKERSSEQRKFLLMLLLGSNLLLAVR